MNSIGEVSVNLKIIQLVEICHNLVYSRSCFPGTRRFKETIEEMNLRIVACRDRLRFEVSGYFPVNQMLLDALKNLYVFREQCNLVLGMIEDCLIGDYEPAVMNDFNSFWMMRAEEMDLMHHLRMFLHTSSTVSIVRI